MGPTLNRSDRERSPNSDWAEVSLFAPVAGAVAIAIGVAVLARMTLPSFGSLGKVAFVGILGVVAGTGVAIYMPKAFVHDRDSDPGGWARAASLWIANARRLSFTVIVGVATAGVIFTSLIIGSSIVQGSQNRSDLPPISVSVERPSLDGPGSPDKIIYGLGSDDPVVRAGSASLLGSLANSNQYDRASAQSTLITFITVRGGLSCSTRADPIHESPDISAAIASLESFGGTRRMFAPRIRLDGAVMNSQDFSDGYFAGASFRRAVLSGANLSRAKFPGFESCTSSLERADLSKANLTGAEFFGTNLRGVEFGSANLTDARLQYVCLAGANLSSANLANAVFYRALDDENTKWPQNQRPPGVVDRC